MNSDPIVPGLTRRSLLGRSAAIGVGATSLGALLAACGGDESSGGTSSSASTSTTAASAAGVINYYSWQGYELGDDHMKAFMKSKGITLKPTFIADPSEIPTKFTTGGGKGLYNLSTYNTAYGPFFKQLGILEPLDMSKLPAYDGSFFDFFKSGATYEKFWNVDGEQLGIPVSWAYAATNYDSAEVPAPKKATDLLKDPYKGKFVLSADSTGLIFQGALIAGVANEDGFFTPDELEQIFDVLDEFKAAARRVNVAFGDIGNLYQSGEIVASLTTWPGLPTLVSGNKAKDIKNVLPEEGALSYCDSYWLPVESKDKEAVYAVINELCTPEAQASYAEFVVTGITNSKAPPLMDKTARDLVPYDDITSLFEKAPLFGLPLDPPDGITTLADWQKRWEEFLNS